MPDGFNVLPIDDNSYGILRLQWTPKPENEYIWKLQYSLPANLENGISAVLPIFTSAKTCRIWGFKTGENEIDEVICSNEIWCITKNLIVFQCKLNIYLTYLLMNIYSQFIFFHAWFKR